MHVVITGASSGIGEALAREFASVGASITLIARRQDKLEALASSLGVPTHVCAVDLSDLDLATSWIAGAEAKLGPIDVMINNAGHQIVAATEQVDATDGERSLRLNLLVPMRITRTLLPGMLKRKQGTLVDVSSMAAFSQNPGMYYYNAGKAGLGAASESLRAELRGTGVHVITVYPGPVRTAMGDASFEKHEINPGRIPTGTPAELAKLIRRAVERRESRVIYPFFYKLGQIFPNLARFATSRSLPPFLKR